MTEKAESGGRTALVTGASTGIGAAIARGLAREGYSIGLHYFHSEHEVNLVARSIEEDGGECAVFQSDISKAGAAASLVDRFLQRFGRIDVLINNAGGLIERCPIDRADDRLYEMVTDLNQRSVFESCRAVIPAMKNQDRGGSIVNVSSIAARNGGGPGSVIYAMAKGAVAALTRGLALELAEFGIRVNAISPGIIDTRFHERWTPPDQYQARIASLPMKRAGTPEECVGAAIFFASDELSSYVTGQTLEINGGQLMP